MRTCDVRESEAVNPGKLSAPSFRKPSSQRGAVKKLRLDLARKRDPACQPMNIEKRQEAKDWSDPSAYN